MQPNRMLPILFLIAFVAGFALNYGVPWLAVDETRAEPEWTWAHELSDELPRGAAQPHVWTLSGLIVGICASLLWLTLAVAVPARMWSRAREAVVIALPLAGLFFTATGGAMGVALAFREAAGDTSTAVSPAGWLIMLLSLAGAGILGWCVRERLPARRAPLYLAVGSVLATAAFHAVPWMTTFYDPSSGDSPTSIFRADLDRIEDPLVLLSAALLVTAFGALAWLLAVGLPPPSRRADPVVDAIFALAALTPLFLATVGLGRVLGMAVSGLFSSGDSRVVVGWNAFLFVALLAAASYLVARTLRRSAADIEGAWSA